MQIFQSWTFPSFPCVFGVSSFGSFVQDDPLHWTALASRILRHVHDPDGSFTYVGTGGWKVTQVYSGVSIGVLNYHCFGTSRGCIVPRLRSSCLYSSRSVALSQGPGPRDGVRVFAQSFEEKNNGRTTKGTRTPSRCYDVFFVEATVEACCCGFQCPMIFPIHRCKGGGVPACFSPPHIGWAPTIFVPEVWSSTRR